MQKIILLGISEYKSRVKKLVQQIYPQYSCESIKGNISYDSVIKKYSAQKIAAIINRGEKYIELHSQLIDHFQLPGPSYSAVRVFRDKTYFHIMMIENGLDDYRPQTIITDLSELCETIKQANFPVVIKPHQGAKSRGVFILNSKEDLTTEIMENLRNHFSQEPSLKNKTEQKILIEEFVVGRQLTSTSYIDHMGKVHTLGFVDVLDGRDFGYSHQQLVTRTTPSYESYNVKNKAMNILQRIADITGLKSTFIHPDFIISPDRKIKLIELNVRMGGLRYEMSRYASKINLDLYSLQLSLGEIPDDEIKKHLSCTGIDIWSEKTGILKNIKIPSNPHIIKSKVYFKKGDKYFSPPQGNQQIARIFVKTHSDSFTIAKKITQKTKVVIK